MGALGYSNSKHSLTTVTEQSHPNGVGVSRPYDMSTVAAMRNGEVLGSQTVLKSDHCPGCQNLSLAELVEGAPNFREIPGFPVYGVANPTVDGIHRVIKRISSSKGGRPVLWHNMREEPVVYINGKPFVLREVERPYKNMLEYTVSISFVLSMEISSFLLIKMLYIHYEYLLRNFDKSNLSK
jgi:Inositol hexakisphosphate